MGFRVLREHFPPSVVRRWSHRRPPQRLSLSSFSSPHSSSDRSHHTSVWSAKGNVGDIAALHDPLPLALPLTRATTTTHHRRCSHLHHCRCLLPSTTLVIADSVALAAAISPPPTILLRLSFCFSASIGLNAQ